MVGKEKNIHDTWSDLHVNRSFLRLRRPESVFVVCKAYLTFDNKFKVGCLVEGNAGLFFQPNLKQPSLHFLSVSLALLLQ